MASHLLDLVTAEVLTCTRCSLSRTRNLAAPGRGNPAAPLLLIGEAPGAQEDAQGVPFCGPAGQLLDHMLDLVGIVESCYVTNVVKCRPPRNETPAPAHAAACAGFLDRQVAALSPRAVVLLGKFAISSSTGWGGNLDAVIEKNPLESRWGVPAFAAYHPAYMLRVMQDSLADFSALLRVQVGVLRAAWDVARPTDAEGVPDRTPPGDE